MKFCIDNDLQERKKITPVFILEEERAKFFDIGNKTKAEITKVISEKLVEIDDEILNKKFKKIKSKPKQVLLDFLNELLNMCSSNED